MTIERWLPVVGYEGMYEVSDFGRVRSVDRSVTYNRFDNPTGRIISVTKRLRSVMLRAGRKPSGHLSVAITRGNSLDVHRLVLEAFVGPRPDGLEGLHEDDDGSNNHLGNLRWGTRSDNLYDAVRNGGKPVGSRHHNARLTESDIPAIRGMLGNNHSMISIGNRYNVSWESIRQIRDGVSWKHVGENS